MKSKEEMIEVMARNITYVAWHKKQQYLRMSSNLYVDKYWINYIPEAEAALKALCGALPDVHTEHKDNPGKNILNTIAECAANYCELVKWGLGK